MGSQDLISVVQILSLFVINLPGLVFVGFIFMLIRKIPKNNKERFMISISIGLLGELILLILSFDIYIFFWIEYKHFFAGFWVLFFIIFGNIIMFPIITIGSYIQLSYRDKIQDYLNSFVKTRSS